MKKKRLIIIATIGLLIGLWIWRYTSLNVYYDTIKNGSTQIYAIGDEIPFGKDYIDYGLQADGYVARVDECRIISFAELEVAWDAQAVPHWNRPDMLAIITITIKNNDSIADGIMLSELELFGVDELIHIDYELLGRLNPVLAGNPGIRLAPDTEYTLILPFGLYENNFSKQTWNHLETYDLFLQITAYPMQKVVKVQ